MGVDEQDLGLIGNRDAAPDRVSSFFGTITTCRGSRETGIGDLSYWLIIGSALFAGLMCLIRRIRFAQVVSFGWILSELPS